MSERDPIIDDFLVECYENLDRLDQDLIVSEENPGDLEMSFAPTSRRSAAPSTFRARAERARRSDQDPANSGDCPGDHHHQRG